MTFMDKWMIFGFLGIGTIVGFTLRPALEIPIITLPDGGLYQGHLNDGVLQGKVSIQWKNSRYYRGEIKDGLFHGQGKLQRADGAIYQGEFKRGVFNGNGELQYDDSSRYVGEFANGLEEGFGVYEDESSIYQGEFKKGDLTGKGSMQINEALIYSGDFNDWVFDGKGQYFSDDKSWKGEFKMGSFSGEGEYIENNDIQYIGQFENWQYDGKGVLYEEDGSRFEGLFRYGKKHGKCIQYLASAVHGVEQYSGEWENDRLIKADPMIFIEENDHYFSMLEKSIYSESIRLDKQFANLDENDPDIVELYFVGVAGDGLQKVFGREIDFISERIGERFNNENKIIKLINDRKRIGKTSMATKFSIKKSIKTISEKMDLDEDVLLLYVSSHGSQKHAISLKQKGLNIPDLEMGSLSKILDESGIIWQIIIVSACYSGGYIQQLSSPTRMIITSSASDKTSFGCSDDADMTYFGKAFFKEAFYQDVSWEKQFILAKQWIEEKENDEKLTPSNPQIFIGNRIIDQINKIVKSVEND